MKRCVRPLLALAFLAGAHNLAAQNKGLSGAIFTTLSDGSSVNANQYSSSCSVYLDGGPGPHAPAKAAGLPDGDYYFQVTNPSGSLLFSTDPVSNRKVTVANGVFVAYTGSGGAPHVMGLDQDHPELGARTIAVANNTCPNDFLLSPEASRAYKVWVTPVASFLGDPLKVDNPCSGGCFHGFVASTSKTDNFTLGPSFCLTIQKQFLDVNGIPMPREQWEFHVTDPTGVMNPFFTDTTGQVKVCGLAAGAYTVAEDQSSYVVGLTVNGVSVPLSTIYSFTWKDKQPDPVVLFVNLDTTPL